MLEDLQNLVAIKAPMLVDGLRSKLDAGDAIHKEGITETSKAIAEVSLAFPMAQWVVDMREVLADTTQKWDDNTFSQSLKTALLGAVEEFNTHETLTVVSMSEIDAILKKGRPGHHFTIESVQLCMSSFFDVAVFKCGDQWTKQQGFKAALFTSRELLPFWQATGDHKLWVQFALDLMKCHQAMTDLISQDIINLNFSMNWRPAIQPMQSQVCMAKELCQKFSDSWTHKASDDDRFPSVEKLFQEVSSCIHDTDKAIVARQELLHTDMCKTMEDLNNRLQQISSGDKDKRGIHWLGDGGNAAWTEWEALKDNYKHTLKGVKQGDLNGMQKEVETFIQDSNQFVEIFNTEKIDRKALIATYMESIGTAMCGKLMKTMIDLDKDERKVDPSRDMILTKTKWAEDKAKAFGNDDKWIYSEHMPVALHSEIQQVISMERACK